MQDQNLKALEFKIDELIRLCNELNGENNALKTKAQALTGERDSLKKKNKLACERVEAVLTKLKSMEQTS